MGSLIRHVALVGLMGAGKTSVARTLAPRLGWPQVDNDATLARRTGDTARELEHEVGVERLHALEADQLLGALSAPERSVLGAAASTIEDARCREALSAPEVFVAWLRAPVSVLADRARRGRHRPELGAADLDVLLERQAKVRDPLFESVANLVVDASQGSPEGLAREIEGAVRGAESKRRGR